VGKYIFDKKKVRRKKMSTKKKNNKGFTLIELIIVIVILGIIAGVAVPKFIGLASSAKTAAARGVGGALSSTIASLHANYLLNTTTYDRAGIVSGTVFAGGINGDNIVTTGSGDAAMNLNYKGTHFTWSYTAQSGDTTAYLTETGTW